MAEEFITDIIGTVEPDASEVVKTEAEMIDSITNPVVEKVEKVPAEKDVAKVELGSEATPDVVKDGEVKESESDIVKELAAQLGWREDHTGEDSVDAKTYILKSKDIQKTMSQHNKDLKQQLQGLNGSVEALQKHNESVYKSELKKLEGEVADLKKERRAAIELADVDKVDELDKQIDDKQKDINAPKPEEKKTDSENPAYDSWVKDNQWYLTDNDMAKFADTVAGQYEGAPLERVYAIVRTKVQEVFPEKFEAVKPAEVVAPVKTPVGPVSPVESSSAKVAGAAFTKADLTPNQLNVMRQFVQLGATTEEKYINDIAKMQ